MPIRFGRAVVLSLLGGVATFVCWLALVGLFWMPYRNALARHGMYVHDIDATYIVAFGPPVVALLFLATIVLAAFFEKALWQRGEELPAWRIAFFGLLPGLATFFLINGFRPDGWRFPLSEFAVCAIGFLLGSLWIRWRRSDETREK